MKHIRVILVIASLLVFSVLHAVNPPPTNDTVCNATDLGTLPIPGLCPTYPYGDTVVVNGTTDWALYNTIDFSPQVCGGYGGPDVWYKFRATGSFLYFEMNGFNDLDSFFVRLWLSQGSCLDMIPLTCEVTYNGFMQASMLTPEVGGEYYLEIGGLTYDEHGPFTFFMKSYNECNNCVKNTSVELTPAPWNGRYGTSDTVQMCVTVERWDQTTTSRLHAIVPTFGDEWDTTTLTPVQFPSSAQNAFWMWGQNVSTPLGSLDGFYFDGNGDGDPTNNPGETGNIATSWTGCWTIATKPYCNSYDAHVEVHVFSDVQTGSANQNAPCQEYWPIHLGISGWCCPDPIVTVVPNGGPCNPWSDLFITPVSASGTDTFTLTLLNDTLGATAYISAITGSVSIGTIAPGDYLLELYNQQTMCASYHQVHVPDAFDIDMTQTVVGCGPGSGSVIATPVGGTGPFSYNWPGITTFNDSLAFSLDEGYVVVSITDGAGCTETDSIYVTVQNAPGAMFGYNDVNYCHNDDTVQVWYQPFTPGGTYQLVAPLSTPITVNTNTGEISLNGATLTTPYFIYVKYSVGVGCTDAFVDSVQIVQQPAAPVASSAQYIDWCISGTAPQLSFQVGTGIPTWYDLQTQVTSFNYALTPPLSWSTTPGLYLYSAQYVADFTGGCISPITPFAIYAHASPNFLLTVADDTLCAGDTTILFANGTTGYTYSWSPVPTSGQQFSPLTYTSPSVTTTYSVTVADSFCVASQSVTVVVQNNADCGMSIYTGLTPNGDGENDYWHIDGAETRVNVTVRIYNRWGEEVWSRNNYNNDDNAFRGNASNGDLLPAGTYFYTLTMDGAEPSGGWLELIR